MWWPLNVQPALWMTDLSASISGAREDTAFPIEPPGRKLQSSAPLLLFLRREDSGWTLRVQRRGSEMKAVPTSCVHVQCLKRAPAMPCLSPSATIQKLKLLRHFLFCFWCCACTRKSICWADFSKEALHASLKANKHCKNTVIERHIPSSNKDFET